MENLIETEEKIIKNLEDHISAEKDNLEIVERYLNRSKLEYSKAAQDIGEYLGNPINAFSFIKRLSIELNALEKFMNKKNGFTKNMLVRYPSEEALAGAARGLVQIQMTYDLNITELANGILNYSSSRKDDQFIEFTTPMSASECYELGLVPVQEQGNMRKISWMKEAYKKLTIENCTLCFVKEIAIIDHLSNSYYQMEDIKNAIEWVQKRATLKPNSEETRRQLKFVKNLEMQVQENTTQINRTMKSLNRKLSRSETLYSGCHKKINVLAEVRKKLKKQISAVLNKVDNGHVVMELNSERATPEPNVQKWTNTWLKCGYKYGPNPFLLLARMKVEVLHLSPDILIFHEAITDTEIRILQHLARPRLYRERFTNKRSVLEFQHYSWANLDESVEYVSKIIRRVSVATTLNLKNEDAFKVINYGIGGYQLPRYDFHSNSSALPPQFLVKGDRIATVMFYLSNIEKGGATVFPRLGLRIQPIKGAIVYWTNLYPSGDGNYLMQYQACPVLRGSKWIGNKWAYEGDQTLCPIWKTPEGIMMTEDTYLKANISEPFRKARFMKTEVSQ